MLKHIFTAPHQAPWRAGSLRLHNVTNLPTQVLNAEERIVALSSDRHLFKARDDGVWITSYVKSGTTWAIAILAALWDHPAQDYAGHLQRTTRTFCPQPELPDLGWGDDGFGHSLEELDGWTLESELRQEVRNFCCFKLHWPYHNFRKAKDNQSKGKTLYVMRNPHDVMISHWNQVWGMGYHYGTTDWPFEGPEGWGRFADEWLAGNVENGSWFEHVAGWYQRSKEEDSNVLLIRYEELKADLDVSVRHIAAFLGMEARVKDLERIRTKTDFSWDVMSSLYWIKFWDSPLRIMSWSMWSNRS